MRPAPPKLVAWSAYGQGADAVPAAIVSLDDCADRRARQTAAGMPRDLVEAYWPGTDLRRATTADLNRFADPEAFARNMHRPPLPSEIGCAVSHRNAAAHMLATGAPLMVTFEDDAIPVRPEALEVLRGILGRLRGPAEAGRAFLCHLGVPRAQRPRRINRRLADSRDRRWCLRDAGPAPHIWRAHAYVLSRAAAAALVEAQSPVVTVADDFAFFQKSGTIDHILHVEPGLFWQDHGQASTVQTKQVEVGDNTAASMDRLSSRDRLRRVFARRFDL